MNPDDYRKFNGILTYSQGDDANGFSVTARGYHGKWNSSDQIPASFGADEFLWRASIRPTAAIRSVTACKPNGIAKMKTPKPKSRPTVFITTSICFPTSLISSRTRISGDQFEQQDQRWVAGLDARHTIFNQWFGRDVENTFGLQVRNDWINNGLYQTEDRVRVDKLDSATGTILPCRPRK